LWWFFFFFILTRDRELKLERIKTNRRLKEKPRRLRKGLVENQTREKTDYPRHFVLTDASWTKSNQTVSSSIIDHQSSIGKQFGEASVRLGHKSLRTLMKRSSSWYLPGDLFMNQVLGSLLCYLAAALGLFFYLFSPEPAAG